MLKYKEGGQDNADGAYYLFKPAINSNSYKLRCNIAGYIYERTNEYRSTVCHA